MMKKKIFAVLMAALMLVSLLPTFALAAQLTDSGDCGEAVSWTLDEDGLLTISGAGEMDNYYNELSSVGAPWATPEGNADRVKKLVVENGVTSVGSEAFLSCKNLESVQLAASVVSIGSRAFSGCSALADLSLAEGLKSIDGYAFFGCTALNSLSIPDSVTMIGASAFQSCASLSQVTVGRGLSFISDSLFSGCAGLQSIVLPEGITAIHPYAFYGCFDLMDVTLPESLADIGINAFGGCNKLHILCHKDSAAAAYAEENGVAYGLLAGTDAENTISGSYNNLDWSIDRKTCTLTLTVDGEMPSFQSLNAVPWTKDAYKNYVHTAVITPGATTVGNLAFFGCDALTQVTIPAGVTLIGASAFYGCNALQEIHLPDSVTGIAAFAFHGCASLTDVSFGSAVNFIGSHAFSSCASLPAVVIPSGVTVVSDSAFADCVRLTGAVIPGTVTTIGADAFARSGLTEVTLPSSVKTVQSRAFKDCASLFSVTFYSTKCTFGSDVMPATTEICGYRNSDAEAYAAANNMKFVEVGGTHVHDFVVVKSVPATCDRTGLNTLACGCGAKKLEVLPKTDLHVQGAAERTVITSATCVAPGEERITVSCTVCGKILLDDTYEIQPTGAHTPGEPVETILRPPTCVTEGQKTVTITCTVCGQDMMNESYVIPATGIHTPGEQVETVLSPATCAKTGVKSISATCTVCGATVWETQVEIPTLPHKDDNSDQICDDCGYAIGQRCSYCGQVHDGSVIGRLTLFIHKIIYFFQHSFGK